MGIALTATLLFGVVLYRGLTYMPDSDLTTLLIGTTAGFVLFSLILNWAGYCGTAARLGKGGRCYDTDQAGDPGFGQGCWMGRFLRLFNSNIHHGFRAGGIELPACRITK